MAPCSVSFRRPGGLPDSVSGAFFGEPVEFRVKGSVRDLLPGLDHASRVINDAVAVALTRTAKDIQAEEKAEIGRVFDRPTAYTLGSVFITPATRTKLSAKIWLKSKMDAGKGTAAEDYLLPQIRGGERKLKRFERALAAIGLLPPGMYCVPAAGAKIDGFGNPDRGQIVQILAWMQAFAENGYRANMTERRKAMLKAGTSKQRGMSYFVVSQRGQRLPMGIWQRTEFGKLGSAVKPVYLFVKAPKYQARWDFLAVAERKQNEVWDGNYAKAVDEVGLWKRSR